MSSDSNIFQEIHQNILTFCSPQASQISDKARLQRETYINSINFYALIIFLFMNCTCLIFGATYTWRIFLLILILIGIMASSFFLSLKSNPTIFRFVNAVIFTLCGPAILTISSDYVFYSMTVSFLCPPLILFLFNQKAWAYASFVLQFIFLNIMYLPVYQRVLMTPILKDLTEIADLQFTTFNFIYLFNAFLLYIIYSLKRSSNNSSSGSNNSKGQLGQSLIILSEKSRSLLNSLVCNLDLAQLEENPSKSKVFVNNAKVCGEILLSHVNTILDIENSNTPQFESNLKSTKVTDLLERMWGTSSEILRKKNLFGTLTLHKTVPSFLMLDQQRIMQIIINILTNSVRFTEKGNVGLSVDWLDKTTINDNIFEPLPFDDEGGIGEARTNTLARPVGRTQPKDNRVYILDTHQKRFIDIIQSRRENSVSKSGILKIIISDTGRGMTEKEANDIFELYPKSLKNIKQEKEIRGFNMWMTNQLCQKLGGSMRVYSRPEKGTTYIICIKTEISESEQIRDIPLSPISIKDNRPSIKKPKGILLDFDPYTVDATKGYLENSRIDVISLTKSSNGLIEFYQKEFRHVQLVTINAHNSLNEARITCEKIRQFENRQNLEPCIILLLADNYSDSQLKECLDQNGNAKVNYFIQMPTTSFEFQKIIANIQSTIISEQKEEFHPKKVLIVDDNAFNLQLLGRILEMNNHEYILAEDGEKAVEAYSNNWSDIAVIFMDCQMPIMDGYEATRKIRKFQQTKKIPRVKILGVTGNVGPQYDRECLDAGMNGTVNKPFPADEIKKIVSECLKQYQ